MPKGRVGRARIMHRDVRAGLGQNKRNLATDAQASARHQRASAAQGKPRRQALRVFAIVTMIRHVARQSAFRVSPSSSWFFSLVPAKVHRR